MKCRITNNSYETYSYIERELTPTEFALVTSIIADLDEAGQGDNFAPYMEITEVD